MLTKLYTYLLIAGLVLFGAWGYGHMQYEKGFVASRTEQTAVILKYQQLVLEKEQARTVEVAKLSSEHAAQIAAIEATKPTEVEKTRVIVKTINRPAVCNLTDDELLDINSAVRASNGSR